MDHGSCLRPVLLLLVVICTMLLNALEQALNVQPEDVQELAEELHRLEHEPRSRSISEVNRRDTPVVSVPSTTEEDSFQKERTTPTKV